jgi:hypothetical protein
VASTEQDHHRVTLAPEVNPVSRTRVDTQFVDTIAHTPGIAEVAEAHSGRR